MLKFELFLVTKLMLRVRYFCENY